MPYLQALRACQMELTRDVQRDGLDFAPGKLRDVFEVSDIAGDELSLGKKGGGGEALSGVNTVEPSQSSRFAGQRQIYGYEKPRGKYILNDFYRRRVAPQVIENRVRIECVHRLHGVDPLIPLLPLFLNFPHQCIAVLPPCVLSRAPYGQHFVGRHERRERAHRTALSRRFLVL